jgi:hypothetical protein
MPQVGKQAHSAGPIKQRSAWVVGHFVGIFQLYANGAMNDGRIAEKGVRP